jgi:sulfur relay (sulfurtransferase) DsrF/TusC family protein
MARSIGILVRRAPYGTIGAAEALRHAAGGLSFGVATTLVLLEDGVFAAKAGQDAGHPGYTSLAEQLAQYARQEGRATDGTALRGRVVVHGPALRARGLERAGLVAGVEVVDDPGLACLLGECDALLTY